MNIFILNTGRCGSTTFIKACNHIENYTCGHESLLHEIGPKRFQYPKNHIEADNRLSWQLGRLDNIYGNNAFYVHLKRKPQDVANSFSKRIDFGILKAYEQGILLHDKHIDPSLDIANDYIDTVDANIKLFLKDKTEKMDISLDNIQADFKLFWTKINAQGNSELALNEWQTRYNAT